MKKDIKRYKRTFNIDITLEATRLALIKQLDSRTQEIMNPTAYDRFLWIQGMMQEIELVMKNQNLTEEDFDKLVDEEAYKLIESRKKEQKNT